MQKITKFLCGIIQQAAKITNKPFNVYAKDDKGDVVTDIDRQVEEFIVAKLNKKYPSFQIVSEEYNPENKLTDDCFIIDPIDGTKNFAAGIPLWGMQVAGMHNGEVVTSVLYFPRLNELFYADCDGAFMNGIKLEIDEEIKSKRPIYCIEGGDKFPALMSMEKEVNRDFRYLACSSVGFSWVAAGRLGGFMLRKDTKWDFLPGLYLVKMAGGYILDKDGGHIGATTEKMLKTLSKHIEEKSK